MIKIPWSEAEINALRYWRFHHPDPRVQVRLEALYLRSQGVATGDIPRLCGISKASFHRYLNAYVAGGIEQLQRLEHYRPQRELVKHRLTLEGYFRQHPPATVAEAAAKIAELTGIVRKPTQVRQFLQALGMKPRKVGMIPAKADVEAQEAFKKKFGATASRSPSGPARRFFRGCSPFRVCALFGHGLVFRTAVCQSALRPPAVECAGRIACHHARGIDRQEPHLYYGGDRL